jgi:elongation factor P
MYGTAEFKKGLKIELDGSPFMIVDFQHVKPGKGGAFVRTKLKNLLTGRVLDQTFRSGEKVKKPDLVEKEMQYLYKDGDSYCLMDNDTYEQIMLTTEQVGDAVLFLTENMNLKVLIFNQQPVAVDLPNFVELTVAQTEPGVRATPPPAAPSPPPWKAGR